MLTPREPSRTALTAAAARAAHLIVDGAPTIFADPLAETLLGDRADELIAYHRAHGTHPVLAGARVQATCRSRYTEERLADAGASQYVILGAGLDSFAYRSSAAVDVYEVDHPATQEWKRRRLASAGVPVPDRVRFVPVDLETEPLADALALAGFDPTRPAMVSWLGVSMYLTRDAIAGTLATLRRFAAGTALVMDYLVPLDLRDADGRLYVDLVAPMTERDGEPWLTYLTPDEASRLLSDHGFEPVEHVEQADLDPALWRRADALRPSNLARLVRARVT